ncbi:MAG: hypothetical protein ACO1SV_21795 [Fimbriimonas sp.]
MKHSIPPTAEPSAEVKSLFKFTPRVLSTILRGFASRDRHRNGIASIVLGPLGWFATNTHRLAWSGTLPRQEEARTTDARAVSVEIARARIFGEECDLESVPFGTGQSPNVRRVIPDMYPVFDLRPDELAEIAKLATALGVSRVTLCALAEEGVTDEGERSPRRRVGFRLKPEKDEPVYCLVSGCSPDGIRPPFSIEVGHCPPAIKAYPKEDASAEQVAA